MKTHVNSSERSRKEHENRFGTSAFVALVSLLGASLGALAAIPTGTPDANGNSQIGHKALEPDNPDQLALEITLKPSVPHVTVKTPKVNTTTNTPKPPTVNQQKFTPHINQRKN
jgi:hypothetical protein